MIPRISNIEGNGSLGKHSFAEWRDNMGQEIMDRKKLAIEWCERGMG